MTLKDAERRWAKRRRRFVVGYIASGNVLYHHERWDRKKLISLPMTWREAKAHLARMPSPGCAIFELMPIATGGGSTTMKRKS